MFEFGMKLFFYGAAFLAIVLPPLLAGVVLAGLGIAVRDHAWLRLAGFSLAAVPVGAVLFFWSVFVFGKVS